MKWYLVLDCNLKIILALRDAFETEQGALDYRDAHPLYQPFQAMLDEEMRGMHPIWIPFQKTKLRK